MFNFVDTPDYVFQNRVGELAIFKSNYNPKGETVYWDFGSQYHDTVFTYVGVL